MSTICKLDSEVRRRRTYRSAIVNRPPAPPRTAKAFGIFVQLLALLRTAYKSPRLTGSEKDSVFSAVVPKLMALQ
jgi:hypothetical protein